MTQNPNSLVRGPVLRDVELSELQPHAGSGDALLASQLNIFAGVKATVNVVAGSAEATVGDLLSLKEGAVLQLDREIDAPFDVVLDGRVLARGQLVAVGEHFGLRVCEVCEPIRR